MTESISVRVAVYRNFLKRNLQHLIIMIFFSHPHQYAHWSFHALDFRVLLCLTFVFMGFLILQSYSINRTGYCSAPT